jgi:hypothetical protein
MNDRIRELAKQAGIVIPKDSEYNGHIYRNSIERFAELIVKECLTQVDKVDAMLDDDKEKTGVAWVGLAIAKHFGVEA